VAVLPAVAFGVVAFATAVPAAANLIANGTFEGGGSGSLSGWAASGGKIALVAGYGGGHAAGLTASSGAKQAYAYTSTKPVKSTAAGTAYTLDGAVRSASGATVCLKLKEVPAGGSSTVASAQQCIAASTAWQGFPQVAFTAARSGDALTVNVVEASPPAGASFDIDDLVLATGAGPADSGPPSVPAGVSASADSSTSATVTWSPSTDDVGVTGYDVYRDGSKAATVAGSKTSWQDTSLQPGTTYSYTVDAFDAAGHTSAPSDPASATTPPGGGGGGGGGSGPCGTLAPSTAPYDHVVVIMDENLTWPAWQAATDAPYTHMLGTNCRLETNAAGETHPSFPNYLAVASGTFNTCLACASSADNIFHQLAGAGMSWRDYNQSMPKNCSPNTSSVKQYRNGHNPAYWFTDLGSKGDGTCAKYDVPADPNMWNDIAADALPSFAWIAPDDCRDMHWMNGTCESVTGKTKASRIAIGDDYIKQVVTAIAATPSYRAGRTLIVVTWDESNEGSVKNKGNWGMNCSSPAVYAANKGTCQVTTILVSARISSGPTGVFYSHYSLTAAIEANFGLPLLGGASGATPAPIY
jgi:phosphatidylinositol-3-phosphatase